MTGDQELVRHTDDFSNGHARAVVMVRRGCEVAQKPRGKRGPLVGERSTTFNLGAGKGAQRASSLDAACMNLIDMANEHGGVDNITVALIKALPA